MIFYVDAGHWLYTARGVPKLCDAGEEAGWAVVYLSACQYVSQSIFNIIERFFHSSKSTSASRLLIECFCLTCVQIMSRELHVRHSGPEPELRIHKLRQLRVRSALRLPTHDAGLLGKPLSNGLFISYFTLDITLRRMCSKIIATMVLLITS